MSELFYRAVRAIGSAVIRVASRPLILHRERAAIDGPYLLAANHESPFDAALLIAATPRVIYWLSIVELFRHPLSRWFLSAMLAAPLDRSRPDPTTARTILRHLRAGRVVGLFPEGGLRSGDASILVKGALPDGLARLAEISRCPVLPCVVVGGIAFARWSAWLPLLRTRWAVAFGTPLHLRADLDRTAAREELGAAIARAMRDLKSEMEGNSKFQNPSSKQSERKG